MQAAITASPEFQSNQLEETQVNVFLPSGNLDPSIVPLETIVQEQANQSCDFNELLLLLGNFSHGLVKGLPEQVSELLLASMVAPDLLHSVKPEHSLEAPERHAERTDDGVFPVADARQATRLCVHVNVVLQKVDVVGHQRPIVFKEARKLREKTVQRRAKALGQSLLEL